MLNLRLSAQPMFLAGAFILLVFFGGSFVGPLFWSQSPSEPTTDVLAVPSVEHLLGTNDIGQDILARLIYGARNTMYVCTAVGLVTTLISAFLGSVSAMLGGIVDRMIMRSVDVLLAIPHIVVILLIASYMRPGTAALILVLSLFGWRGPVKIVRASVLIEKNRPSVLAARTFGATTTYTIAKHILPDLSPILISIFVQNARRAVFMEAGLAFLGVSDTQMISWGGLFNHALQFTYLDVWKWWLMPPVIALSMVLLGFSFVGYALELHIIPGLKNE